MLGTRWASFCMLSPPMTIFDSLPIFPHPVLPPNNPQIERPHALGYGLNIWRGGPDELH